VQRRRSRIAQKTAEELFGQALREFRKERGLTQEELAFQSGYHPTYVGQLERGRKSPSLRAIICLASALKIYASELIKRVEILLEEAPPSKGVVG
jgi:transcriptional regulator with XRE-family HTH domain